jgi:cytochrome P450
MMFIKADIYLNPRITKSRVYLKSRTNESSSIFNTIDEEAYRQKRKIINLPFSDRSLRAFEPTMLNQIQIFLGRIYDSSLTGKSINMTDYCNHLAVDIVGLLAFGYHLNLQTEDTYRFLPWAFAIGKSRVNIFMHFPAISILDRLVKFLGRRARKRILSMLAAMIKSRIAQESDAKPDFYSFAAGHMGEGSDDDIENSELFAEATFLVTAG